MVYGVLGASRATHDSGIPSLLLAYIDGWLGGAITCYCDDPQLYGKLSADDFPCTALLAVFMKGI